MANFRQYSNNKSVWVVVSSIILVVVIIFAIKALLGAANKPANSSSQVQLSTPNATKSINKDLTIPIKDDKGVTQATIKYSFRDAELTNEIIVQGVKKTSVVGRTFLIINLKLSNDSTKKIQIETRDYVRMAVNSNEKELLAPDIHNDPVEIQALSTKYSRVGFIINSSDKKLKLKIGEINGDKTNFDLNF